MTETAPRHRAAFVIHAVPDGSGTLTAVCGEQIDGQTHTGHWPYMGRLLASPGQHLCSKCTNEVSR